MIRSVEFQEGVELENTCTMMHTRAGHQAVAPCNTASEFQEEVTRKRLDKAHLGKGHGGGRARKHLHNAAHLGRLGFSGHQGATIWCLAL